MPKWGKRLLFTAVGLFAAFMLVAVVLQVPAVGQTIGSPDMCGTCHLMTPEVKTLQASAHRDLSCLDCHSSHGFFEKPIDEVKSSARHIYVTLTKTEPNVVTITEDSRRIVEENCQSCHASLVRELHGGGPARNCTDCHRATPHDTASGVKN